MAYTYNKVNWENLPSTTTPRNSTTLGNMDTGIKENNDMLLGTKPAGNMIVDSIRSKNMFDKNTALKNAWLGDSGQINSYTNDNLVSGYIPVKPNTSYTASGYYANKYLKICGYNSNKEFTQIIIDINSSQTYQTITTGPNDYFIRVGYGDSVSTADTLQFEKGSVVSSYSPYHQLMIDDTGWIDISQYLNTTYFAVRSGYTPMIRKINNVVYLKGAVYCHTSPNNIFATLFSNLPSEFIATYESLGGGVHWDLSTPYAINMGSGSISVTESSNISPTYDYQGYALTNIPTYIVDRW